jgi:NAD(P)-dependent dehydrogenase (short-subunit alcohol dehydrogenase family)
MRRAVVNLLIVGASNAIGRAVAHRMAPRTRIILVDDDTAAMRPLLDELKSAGHDACSYSVDVSRKASVQEMFARIDREVGPVNAVFYGAGIREAKPLDLITEQDWDATIATHVKGAYLCAKAVMPQMRERRDGAIVTLASDYAVIGSTDNVAYAAAQTALYALTKSLAQALASDGIRVNAVAIGAIDCDFLHFGKSRDEWEKFKSTRAQSVPMQRLAQPEEVAAVADFLLSDRSTYLTGQIVHVNGGELTW